MRACVRACVRASMCLCVGAFVRARLSVAHAGSIVVTLFICIFQTESHVVLKLAPITFSPAVAVVDISGRFCLISRGS